jgi:VWFA-related protein
MESHEGYGAFEMMATNRRLVLLAVWMAALLVGAWIYLPPSGVLAQGEQQPTTGPNPNVGETVVVPKKTPPPAQVPAEEKHEKINPDEIYTLSTTTDLVNVDVLVTTDGGQPIGTLGKGNFRIYDDDVPQAISNFGISKSPMTVAMLIEFSRKYWQFLYLALRDAYQFLSFMQPQDWVAVIDFDMQQHILTDFTQDRNEVRNALDHLRYPEFSEVNMYDSLAFTLDRMKNIQGRKAILLIGTGCDTFSKLNYGDILKITKSTDTAIYPVSIYEFLTVRYGEYVPCGPGTGGFGASLNSAQARNALMSIAKNSGGQAYFPRFEGELPGVFEQIAGQLRTQYSIGFIPTNPAKDGRFHKLKVDVVNAQGEALKIVDQKGKKVKYRVVSRDGYYAPKT